MRFGPILRSELIRMARRPSAFVVRAVLALALPEAVWAVDSLRSRYGSTPGGRPFTTTAQGAAPLGDLLFLELAWIQGVLLVAVTPGLVAGAIGEEDRRGTMLELLASPLSSPAIVLGKLVARLLQAGALLVLGLPLVAPLLLVGAPDPAIAEHAVVLVLALTGFVASLALLVSVLLPGKPGRAVVVAYVLVGTWLLMPLLVPTPFRPGSVAPGWLSRAFRLLLGSDLLAQGLLALHPGETAAYLGEVAEAEVFRDPGALAWGWSGVARTFWRTVGLQAAASVVFLAAAVACLRPLRLGTVRWLPSRRLRPGSARPVLGDDPMLWKEQLGSGRRAWLVGSLFLGAVLFGPLIGPALAAFGEWWIDGGPGIYPVQARWELNQTLRSLQTGLIVVMMVAVATIAAGSVTGERERGTWTSLATTLLTGREVARAKVVGALWSVRGLAVLFPVLWGLGLATGSVHPLGVCASALAVGVFAGYAAALGVLVSMLATATSRAVAATSIALLIVTTTAFVFVPLGVLGSIAASWSGLYLAGVAPFVAWCSLVSSVELQAASAGRPWDGWIGIPGLWSTRVLLDFGLIRTYVVGLAAHGLVAALATWGAAWEFDRSRGTGGGDSTRTRGFLRPPAPATMGRRGT